MFFNFTKHAIPFVLLLSLSAVTYAADSTDVSNDSTNINPNNTTQTPMQLVSVPNTQNPRSDCYEVSTGGVLIWGTSGGNDNASSNALQNMCQPRNGVAYGPIGIGGYMYSPGAPSGPGQTGGTWCGPEGAFGSHCLFQGIGYQASLLCCPLQNTWQPLQATGK